MPRTHNVGAGALARRKSFRRQSGRRARLQRAVSPVRHQDSRSRRRRLGGIEPSERVARALQKIAEAAQELPADDPSQAASEVARGGLGRRPRAGPRAKAWAGTHVVIERRSSSNRDALTTWSGAIVGAPLRPGPALPRRRAGAERRSPERAHRLGADRGRPDRDPHRVAELLLAKTRGAARASRLACFFANGAASSSAGA
jgi:hypothetical protein